MKAAVRGQVLLRLMRRQQQDLLAHAQGSEGDLALIDRPGLEGAVGARRTQALERDG
jgi:hypothetical protein